MHLWNSHELVAVQLHEQPKKTEEAATNRKGRFFSLLPQWLQPRSGTFCKHTIIVPCSRLVVHCCATWYRQRVAGRGEGNRGVCPVLGSRYLAGSCTGVTGRGAMESGGCFGML